MIEVLRAAHRAGIGADAALDMTPFLLGELLDEEAGEIRHRQRWDMFSVHQHAVLMRTKEIPPMKTFLAPFDDKQDPESDSERTERSFDQTLRTAAEQRDAVRAHIRDQAKRLAQKRKAANAR